MHRDERILPELQQLELDEVLSMRPNEPGMRVEILDRARATSARSQAGAWVSWFALVLALVPHNGSTRPISRAHVHTPPQRIGMPAMEAGSLVMERKVLCRIKQRAERGAAIPQHALCQSELTATNREI